MRRIVWMVKGKLGTVRLESKVDLKRREVRLGQGGAKVSVEVMFFRVQKIVDMQLPTHTRYLVPAYYITISLLVPTRGQRRARRIVSE